jgi:hypothetical protein
MIGGGGEKMTLRITAEYADMWNTFPPLDNWRRKNEILTEWCQRLGRDPKQIERTCSVNQDLFGDLEAFLAVGAEHLILRGAQPFDLKPLEELLRLAGA